MNPIMRLFLDKLSERVFSLLGSNIGTAATTYHAIQQAEQQSVLEDLAREYEADGKPELAAKLRQQATLIASGDPALLGKQILTQVTEAEQAPLQIAKAESPSGSASRKPRSRRLIAMPTETEDGTSNESL